MLSMMPVAFGNKPTTSTIPEVRKQYPVVNTMMDLIAIPTPTPQKDPKFRDAVERQMDKMEAHIIGQVRALGITDIEQNEHGSLIIRVPGSKGYENRQPLMLTAHMDMVVGDPTRPDRPVNPRMTQLNGREFIATDGTTTLGSDDKGGLAMILDNLARLQGKHPLQRTPLPHVPLEIILSPDEESSAASLKKLDGKTLKAKHVLVVDEFDPFKVTNGLASSVHVEVDIKGLKGGHSGADITDTSRINGIMVMSELVKRLGTGVIEMDPDNPGMPLISKNIGIIEGGYAPNAIPNKGKLTIMLRSASKKAQDKEIRRIRQVVRDIEAKYQPQEPDFKLGLHVNEEYPAWQNPNSALVPIAKDAGARVGHSVEVGPIHAAAQASILASKTNARGEKFDAVLIGPYIRDAHTVSEKIDWRSLVEANQWLGQMIQEYTRRGL